MYRVEDISDITKKFGDYIASYISELESKLEKVSNTKFYEDLKNILKTSTDLEDFLHIEKDILKINPSLKGIFDILNFYYENNASNAPQARKAIENLKNSDLQSKIDVLLQNTEEKSKLEEEIKKCKMILANNITDWDYYFDLIKKSDLTDEEQIELLSKIAYESTLEKEKVTAKEGEKDESKKEEPKKEYVSTEKMGVELERLRELNRKIDSYISKYSSLVNTKTPNQITMYKEVINALGTNLYDEVGNYKVKEEAIILLTFRAQTLQADISSVVSSLKSTYEKEDFDMLELYLDELSKIEDLLSGLDSEITEEEKEVNSNGTKNVIYLTDENNNPYFSYSNLQFEQKLSYKTLLEKISKGLFDYKKHKNGATVLGTKSNRVYVNISGRYGCSYVILNDEYLLVLSLASYQNVYSESLKIESQEEKKIKELKQNPELAYDILISQSDLRNKIEEEISEDKGVVL